jgi:NAD(P)-dependent dehydrogenase (short-subunit alcohol dehydrogenase family)
LLDASCSLLVGLAQHHIRANVVAPGVLGAGVSAQNFREFPERRAPFQKMIPLGTLGTAEQVAESLVFLASDLERHWWWMVGRACSSSSPSSATTDKATHGSAALNSQLH